MRKQDMTHTMRQPLVALLLALMLVVAGAGPARADVLHDDNGNAEDGTVLGFTVPAEEDRLLVVCVAMGAGSVSGVTFDGMAMTRAIEQVASSRFGVSIWVLPLGSSGAPDTGNIVASGSGIPYLGAASFHGVDQADPIDGATWVQIPGGASSSSLEVESESGDQVFDCLHGFSWPAFTATPVGGQSRIFEAGNSMWSFAGGRAPAATAPSRWIGSSPRIYLIRACTQASTSTRVAEPRPSIWSPLPPRRRTTASGWTGRRPARWTTWGSTSTARPGMASGCASMTP